MCVSVSLLAFWAIYQMIELYGVLVFCVLGQSVIRLPYQSVGEIPKDMALKITKSGFGNSAVVHSIFKE